MSHESTRTASIAAVYAVALYDAATAAGAINDVISDVAAVADLAHKQAELGEFLRSPAVSSEQKMQVLERSIGPFLNDLTLSTLRAMAQRDRLDILTEFIREMEILHRKRRGRLLVDAMTPKPLTAEEIQHIEKVLSEKYHAQVALNIISAPNLIGGIQLKIGDTFVDGSVRQKLFDMTRRIRHGVLTDVAADSQRMVQA